MKGGVDLPRRSSGKLIFIFTKTPAGFLFTEVGAND
jgi:hypothetical protein